MLIFIVYFHSNHVSSSISIKSIGGSNISNIVFIDLFVVYFLLYLNTKCMGRVQIFDHPVYLFFNCIVVYLCFFMFSFFSSFSFAIPCSLFWCNCLSCFLCFQFANLCFYSMLMSCMFVLPLFAICCYFLFYAGSVLLLV